MTSTSSIKRLENKYDRLTSRSATEFVVRHICDDGRPIDENGFLLTSEEIRKNEIEDQETCQQGGMIIELTNYSEPKIRDTLLS